MVAATRDPTCTELCTIVVDTMPVWHLLALYCCGVRALHVLVQSSIRPSMRSYIVLFIINIIIKYIYLVAIFSRGNAPNSLLEE
jgi:biotin transporter BioY